MRSDEKAEAPKVPADFESGTPEILAEKVREVDLAERTTEQMLTTIFSLRKRLTADQVTWIREQVLLERTPVPIIVKKIYPAMAISSIWNIVRGRSYKHVPLSRRLKLAYHASKKKRAITECDDNETDA